MNRERCDVAIIGGGPAGLSAAVYAARALLKVVVCEEMMPGGQLNLAETLENYPGFAESISAPDLGVALTKQAQAMGAVIRAAGVLSLAQGDDGFRLTLADGELAARAVIVATGSRWRKLGVPGEEEYTGRGVSYCATCDGAFFRGKEVAVVGGGDTAVKEALFLTRFCPKIHLIHRRDRLRAEPVMAKQLLDHRGIVTVWDSVVTAIAGDARAVTGLRLKNVKDNSERDLPVQGVFVFVGTQPRSELAKMLTDQDARGMIIVRHDGATRTPGLFAAGDVRAGSPRQVITAAGDGATAAMSAINYLEVV